MVKVIFIGKHNCIFHCLVFRYVFWTDWGLSPYIGRAGLDGSNQTQIINTKLSWPNGITIDIITDKIWWCDAHLDFIE